MTKALYCDCFSGISGDMFLAAVVDAGFSVELLQAELRKLRLPAFEGITIETVQKGALRATSLKFRIAKDSDTSEHRHLADIEKIIQQSNLSTPVIVTAVNIFTCLAEAEAKVHGIDIKAVHFHEVGGDDAILDIVGAAIVLDQLNIEHLFASPLPLGTGKVNTQHGLLPVPAPATLELMRAKNCPVVPAPGDGELVTPTGAAIVSSLATFSQPVFRIEKVGIGAGEKSFFWPNILRVVIGEMEDQANLVLLETNIDDMNPEIYGYLFERLFAASALDVFLTPIIMKKNRPATKVSVLAKESHETTIIDILMRETSTLGIRKFPVQRYEAARTRESILTEWGEVTIKIKKLNDEESIQVSPEYEDCLKLARETGVSLLEIYQQATAIAHQKYLRNVDSI
jgi:pyridinium-3,5-bisthiocarboxylic acid mononucleotide nickel chelatase